MDFFRQPSTILVLAAAALVGVLGATQFRTRVRTSDPPVQGFYAKYLDCCGIPVRSSAAVEDRALERACGKIDLMLSHLADVRTRLVQQGAELHIIGRNEQTSDLPEFRAERGKRYVDNTGRSVTIDERTRGKGGLRSSCGEENILNLPSDRYRGGSDICIHEFSHGIMNFGLTEAQRQRIREQYARSLASGLWLGSYAATTPQEYWAELSMWYFGAHGDRRMKGAPPADGTEGLRQYDPAGYAVLDALYRGRQ